MYCSKCGKEINDLAVICVHCGCAVESRQAPVKNPDDAPSFGWAFLGFLIPVLGLVLFLTNKETYPRKAKSAIIGTIVGFCVSIVISIVCSVIYTIVMEELLRDGYYYYY